MVEFWIGILNLFSRLLLSCVDNDDEVDEEEVETAAIAAGAAAAAAEAGNEVADPPRQWSMY